MPVKARTCRPCARGGGAADKRRPASPRHGALASPPVSPESSRRLDALTGDTSTDGPVRASGAKYPFVPRAVDQSEQHMLEHSRVGDRAAVTAKRVARGEFPPSGHERHELVPEGFEQARWQCGHGRPSRSPSVEDFMIAWPRGHSEPRRLPGTCCPVGLRKKLSRPSSRRSAPEGSRRGRCGGRTPGSSTRRPSAG